MLAIFLPHSHILLTFCMKQIKHDTTKNSNLKTSILDVFNTEPSSVAGNYMLGVRHKNTR